MYNVTVWIAPSIHNAANVLLLQFHAALYDYEVSHVCPETFHMIPFALLSIVYTVVHINGTLH